MKQTQLKTEWGVGRRVRKRDREKRIKRVGGEVKVRIEMSWG
jgi:hypothetical protein